MKKSAKALPKWYPLASYRADYTKMGHDEIDDFLEGLYARGLAKFLYEKGEIDDAKLVFNRKILENDKFFSQECFRTNLPNQPASYLKKDYLILLYHSLKYDVAAIEIENNLFSNGIERYSGTDNKYNADNFILPPCPIDDFSMPFIVDLSYDDETIIRDLQHKLNQLRRVTKEPKKFRRFDFEKYLRELRSYSILEAFDLYYYKKIFGEDYADHLIARTIYAYVDGSIDETDRLRKVALDRIDLFFDVHYMSQIRTAFSYWKIDSDPS